MIDFPMEFVRRILLFSVVLISSGCAHAILVAPDTDRLPNAATAGRSTKAVGYYISAADRSNVFTTAGGGGDKVSYSPYKDLEPALYHALSNRFERVYSLPSGEDHAFIAEKNIQFVFTPRFETQSSSSSLLTWPPTDFSVTIDVSAIDSAAKIVWQTHVTGAGHAEFSEFKRDFGLAAKRAAEQAFQHLDAELGLFPNP